MANFYNGKTEMQLHNLFLAAHKNELNELGEEEVEHFCE